jgi:hypothetical protein
VVSFLLAYFRGTYYLYFAVEAANISELLAGVYKSMHIYNNSEFYNLKGLSPIKMKGSHLFSNHNWMSV